MDSSRIPFEILQWKHTWTFHNHSETVKYSFWPTCQLRGTLHGGVYWTICALFILDQMKIDKCRCSSRQLAFPNTPFSRQVPFSPIYGFLRWSFGIIIVCPEYVNVSVIFASNKDKVSLMKYFYFVGHKHLCKTTRSISYIKYTVLLI